MKSNLIKITGSVSSAIKAGLNFTSAPQLYDNDNLIVIIKEMIEIVFKKWQSYGYHIAYEDGDESYVWDANSLIIQNLYSFMAVTPNALHFSDIDIVETNTNFEASGKTRGMSEDSPIDSTSNFADGGIKSPSAKSVGATEQKSRNVIDSADNRRQRFIDTVIRGYNMLNFIEDSLKPMIYELNCIS